QEPPPVAPKAELPTRRLSPREVDSLLASSDSAQPISAAQTTDDKSSTAGAEPAEPAASPPADPSATGSQEADPEQPKSAASPSPIGLSEAEVHTLARKLRIATIKANQEIYDAASADIAKTGMGTTLTGLLLVR